MGLETYWQKRDFTQTPEPPGKVSKRNLHRFVVQEHHASMLHFDFRLEMDGVLKSWSIRKGPSLDPREKRLAVATEDHPVEYLKFQGHIPAGNYGAGEHIIWDAGVYELVGEEDALAQLAAGKIKFRLKGEKLRGVWNLVRLGRSENQWLLIKSRDEFAEAGWQLETLLKTNKGSDESQRARSRTKSKEGADAKPKTVRKISSKAQDADGKIVAARSAFRAQTLSGDVTIKVGSEAVALTRLDKIFWPEDGFTKGDLIRYYYEVSKYILPYLEDRPLIMKRYPNGIGGKFFHQHDVDEAPDYVRTAKVDVEEGHAVDYIVGDNVATLLYMANIGAIERHPWHSRLADLAHPDWLVFDLDPGAGIAFETICELALKVRDAIARLGLESYAKTSGSRGLHVYVPIKAEYSYEDVAKFAEELATRVAFENSEIATVERALKGRRQGQIYVDHMQNARGKSVVAPYSVRPRIGATVSAPLEWSEVEKKKITIQDFTIRNMLKRLERKGDLFKPVLNNKQNLREAFVELQSLTEKSQTKQEKKRTQVKRT
jgi:bifunctional non-homologous end joining protein LigD